MTPAERLLQAADLLDKRAGEATEGPWRADFVTEIDPDGAFDLAHVLAPNDDPADGYAGIAVAAGILRPDATYIATMHPEVGKAQAALLRAFGGVDYPETRAGVSRYTQSLFDAALDLADSVLASSTRH